MENQAATSPESLYLGNYLLESLANTLAHNQSRYPVPGYPQLSALSAPILADEIFTGASLVHNLNEMKRRRIARACDRCRKKKIKCDGKLPACTHCETHKIICNFTVVKKKRPPFRGAKYVEELESRLERLESIFRRSGLLSDNEDLQVDLEVVEKRLCQRAVTQQRSVPKLEEPELDCASDAISDTIESTSDLSLSDPVDPDSLEGLSDRFCSLVTDDSGEHRYIGSSSGFSIFSPQGIQWINEKVGDTSFQDMIFSAAGIDNIWIHWRPEIFKDIFQRCVYQPLSSKAEVMNDLKIYFEHFNCMFPLFHEATFMQLVEKQYECDSILEETGWWACLNVALAISRRLQAMDSTKPESEDSKAWGYMKNALATYNELTIRNTDFWSVQALLGMALFLQGTPNPQVSYSFVSSALRLAHSLGLHKRGTGFGLTPIEVEQRKRVFWIAFMLDKDISLRSGRPPIQDVDDMNIDLPSFNPPDCVVGISLSDTEPRINLFLIMCKFSIISSLVYKKLYSVKVSRQSEERLLRAICDLDVELEEWKNEICEVIRPGQELSALPTPVMLHVIVLHFAYYNCLATIHRISAHYGQCNDRLQKILFAKRNASWISPRIFCSEMQCVKAARETVKLIKYLPNGDFSCVWMVIYFPVSAMVTLFANILQNPFDPSAVDDIELMKEVEGLLAVLASEEKGGTVSRMKNICAEFIRVSSILVEKSRGENINDKKRKSLHTTEGDTDEITGIVRAEPLYMESFSEDEKVMDELNIPETSVTMHQHTLSLKINGNDHGFGTPVVDDFERSSSISVTNPNKVSQKILNAAIKDDFSFGLANKSVKNPVVTSNPNSSIFTTGHGSATLDLCAPLLTTTNAMPMDFYNPFQGLPDNDTDLQTELSERVRSDAVFLNTDPMSALSTVGLDFFIDPADINMGKLIASTPTESSTTLDPYTSSLQDSTVTASTLSSTPTAMATATVTAAHTSVCDGINPHQIHETVKLLVPTSAESSLPSVVARSVVSLTSQTSFIDMLNGNKSGTYTVD